MRARPDPTVSTPVTWDEVAEAAEGDNDLRFLWTDVLDRVEEIGDVFAPVLTTEQRLPAAAG
jgi:bifunctional non-homologous end joining protein LigD